MASSSPKPAPRLDKFVMKGRDARQLRGKIVDRIERDDTSIRLMFSDGTGIEISPSHPTDRTYLMAFTLRPMTVSR